MGIVSVSMDRGRSRSRAPYRCTSRSHRRGGARPAGALRSQSAPIREARPALEAIRRAVPGCTGHPPSGSYRNFGSTVDPRTRRSVAVRSDRHSRGGPPQRRNGLHPGIPRRGRARRAARHVSSGCRSYSRRRAEARARSRTRPGRPPAHRGRRQNPCRCATDWLRVAANR